ncbi:hypothetical protein C8233_17800 [Halomonas sp. SF2003]|nr:hypothetical protein C8233_17800 [Halomonas sp. SF2003]
MLIVSLTTTSSRLKYCRAALTSLLLQTKVPDKIYLWISNDSYLRDQGFQDNSQIEELLLSLTVANVDIITPRWTVNTGPYRKLIPLLREANNDDILITADDDIFYDKNWLINLLKNYDHGQNIAVAARVRQLDYNFFGKLKSYVHWRLINSQTVLSDNYLITFGGGAVLNKSMFAEKDIHSDAYMNLAPTSDDLWYTSLLIRNSIKVKIESDILKDITFLEHSDGLTNHNKPRIDSLYDKIKLRIYNNLFGWFGFSVCENDRAYNRIKKMH